MSPLHQRWDATASATARPGCVPDSRPAHRCLRDRHLRSASEPTAIDREDDAMHVVGGG